MPMYEVEWTEVRKHKANVLIPSDDKALHGAIRDPQTGVPEIVSWIKQDNNPIVSAGQTELTVTALGRVRDDGKVQPL